MMIFKHKTNYVGNKPNKNEFRMKKREKYKYTTSTREKGKTGFETCSLFRTECKSGALDILVVTSDDLASATKTSTEADQPFQRKPSVDSPGTWFGEGGEGQNRDILFGCIKRCPLWDKNAETNTPGVIQAGLFFL